MSEKDLISSDINAYITNQAAKDTLRFITCGSVDDGKSTLIGRLLYESKMIFDDQHQHCKKIPINLERKVMKSTLRF